MLHPKDIEQLNGYKTRPVYIIPTRDSLQMQRHIQTESEGMEKGIPCKQKSKESQSSNTYIRQDRLQNKDFTRDKDEHYIRIKGSIQEGNITIVNIYAPNIGAPKYIRQILTDIKGEIDSNTIIIRDFNTPLTSMDRSSRQKINKKTQALNNTLDKWT